jgi:hypothetical protein
MGEDDDELTAGESASEPEVTNATTAMSRNERYQEHDLFLTLA